MNYAITARRPLNPRKYAFMEARTFEELADATAEGDRLMAVYQDVCLIMVCTGQTFSLTRDVL